MTTEPRCLYDEYLVLLGFEPKGYLKMSTAVMRGAVPAPPLQLEGSFTTIELRFLRESKTNPRRHFAGVEELAASVKQHGVLTPLLVRRTDGGELTYEIIAGARRYRAAKSAGIAAVPCRVLALTDEQALEFQVIENLQREDVHPLDEALGYQALLRDGRYDVPSIAAKVSKSESYVYQRLKLAALIPAAQKMFFSDEITAGHAILIARLQPREQEKLLADIRRNGDDGIGGVRALARRIHEDFHLELRNAPWDLADEALLPAAGSCVKCPKRTGANPQLFPDVKAKDICTDPACYRKKLEAQVEQNTKNGLVSISSGYREYGEKGVPGVLYQGNGGYTFADKKCPSSKDAVVVLSGGYHGDAKVGIEKRICADAKCKVHHPYGAEDVSQFSGTSPKQKAADRKQLAIAKVRTLALGKIAEAKLSFNVCAGVIAEALLGRLHHDAAKLLANGLGIVPAKGKVVGFDYREAIEKRVAEIQKAGNFARRIVPLLAAAAATPAFGGWNNDYHGEDKERLQRVAKAAHVPLAKMESGALAAIKSKKSASKAKVQTSARKGKKRK